MCIVCIAIVCYSNKLSVGGSRTYSLDLFTGVNFNLVL